MLLARARGWLKEPPPFFLNSGTSLSSKIMLLLIFTSIPIHLSIFQIFLFIGNKENVQNVKIYWKIFKNERNFQFSQFLSYINMIYFKRMYFSHRIWIQTEISYFISENLQENWIFYILGQEWGWPVAFSFKSLKSWLENLKREST